MPSCGRGLVILLDPDSKDVRVLPMRCRKWSCPYCATVRLRDAQQKARSGHPERHIVLTLIPHTRLSLPEELTFLRASFRQLLKLTRREFKRFEYMAVVELQKNGTPHMHLLTRGTYIPQKWLSKTWQRITGAWNVHIGAITRTRNSIHELTKYLAKTAVALQEKVGHVNIITTSKHYVIDPPDKDPAYSERNWTCFWIPFDLEDLQRCLALLDRALVPNPDSASLLMVNNHSPPSADAQATARKDCPCWLVELMDLAVDIALGFDATSNWCTLVTSRIDPA